MTARPLVAVTDVLPRAWLEPLVQACDVVACDEDAPGVLSPPILEAAPRVEGLLCTLEDRIDASTLDRFPRLRVVSTLSVGFDHIDLAACAARGIVVGHTPGVLTDATADLAMTLMLACARRLPEATASVREGRWGRWRPTGLLGLELAGKVLGLVGFGQIGRAVARRARAFGMEILFVRRTPTDDPLGRRVDLDTLTANADVVSLHVPLSDETRGWVDGAFLARMKPGALLVNTARGAVVDTDALVDALRAGHLGGAGLDVTDPEPLPADHPLLDMPNVVVTPHIGSATTDTRRRMARLAIDNLLAGLSGRPLPHAVALPAASTLAHNGGPG
ncbi:MAG: D-glycerate dehydrogenase [Deltaproteobacteria bacterium]|nr:MAG: D-glycerate dehydrogenase [Deltaproteobacteria bacterium]